MASAIGSLAAISLPYAVLLIAVLVGLAVLWTRPIFGLNLVVLLMCLRLDKLTGLGLEQIALVQKATILTSLAFLIAQRGIRNWAGAAPVSALVLILAFSLTLAAPFAGNNLNQAVSSFVTLSVGWFATVVRFSVREIWQTLWLLALSPLISVALAIVLTPFGVRLFAADYTGVVRLQGATISAYLAGLSVVALMALIAIWRISRNSYGIRTWILSVLGGLNLAILIGTTARIPFIAAVFLFVPVAWFGPRVIEDFGYRVLFRGAILVIIAVVLAIFVPRLVFRSEDAYGDVNTSGRDEAWAFFVQQASENQLFGRGLGAGPLAATARSAPQIVRDNFTAQHNEYIRFYLEGGWVGVVLMVVAVLLFFALAVRQVHPDLKPYFAAAGIMLAVYSSADNTFTSIVVFVPLGLCLSGYLASAEIIYARSHVEICRHTASRDRQSTRHWQVLHRA